MIAHDDYDRKASAKCPQLKIGNNHELAKKLEECIIEGKCSPYATIEKLRYDPSYPETPISERTLYNYIEQDVLENVTKKDLPHKGKSSKGRYTRVTKRVKDVDAKRIDDRSKEADERSELGHGEMDCVESGRGKGRACLLVLVERMSRKTLIFKLRSQTQKEVQRRLDQYEKALGIKRFQAMFKSITVDNGSEFLDWRSLERSCVSKREVLRTQIYYCHPLSFLGKRNKRADKRAYTKIYTQRLCDIRLQHKIYAKYSKMAKYLSAKVLYGKTSLEIVREELERAA